MGYNIEPSVSLPQICAPREDLVRFFDQCSKKQCIYIQAPAGYGKTISALLWLKKSGCRSAWFTLDKYDNSLTLFYRSFCQSLLAAFPQSDAVDALASSPLFSLSPVESTMEFLTMFSWRKGKNALVVDDLHIITNEEILKSLPYVLRRLPGTVNVLLISRTALPQTMDSLNDDEKMAFISAKELSFTPDEIHSYFTNCGKAISQKEAFDLYANTDGWVIILNAMLMQKNREFSETEFKSSFTEFFKKNIWNGFDENTQVFLMKTSVVDSFTLKLCQMLTERTDSGEVLGKLLCGNVNMSRLGEEFRYHNLFLEFLRGQLEISDIDRIRLYDCVTRYYLETGQFYKAAAFSLRGEDKQLESQVIGNFFRSKTPILEQFLELSRVYDFNQLSREKCDAYPIRYMPNILAAFLSGNAGAVIRLFDLFYAALPAFLTFRHTIGAVAVTRLLLDFRVKLSDLPSFINSLHLKIENSVPGQAAIVTLQMPLLHRSVRDFSGFLNEDTRENVRGLFSCLLPDDCDFFYQSIAAGLLMEQNGLNEAFDLARRAYTEMTETVNAGIYFGVSVILAEICAARNDKNEYQSVICNLHQWIGKNKAQYLLKNLLAYEERAKIEEGDRKAAEDWLKNYFVSDSLSLELYKIYQVFTTVRAYIVLAMNEKAATLLEQIHKLGEAMDRPLDMAEAEVLLSIVEWSTGSKKNARERLHRLLIFLYPYRYVRIVANEGNAVLPILVSVLKTIDKEGGNGLAFYRYVKEVHVAAYEQSRRSGGLCHGHNPAQTAKLSKQQALVLGLLAKGYRNAQIVDVTGLSLNTIRYHTKIVYQKLEVTNAMDAIVRAKELDLLK